MAKAKQNQGAPAPESNPGDPDPKPDSGSGPSGFLVLSSLWRNGKSYEAGSVINLSEDDAGPLLSVGTLSRVNQGSTEDDQ